VSIFNSHITFTILVRNPLTYRNLTLLLKDSCVEIRLRDLHLYLLCCPHNKVSTPRNPSSYDIAKFLMIHLISFSSHHMIDHRNPFNLSILEHLHLCDFNVSRESKIIIFNSSSVDTHTLVMKINTLSFIIIKY